MTNIEFVTSLMEDSRFGPMAQLFVLQAIEKYSKACAEAPAEQMDNTIISGRLWKAVATEIHQKCEARYSKDDTKQQ